MNTENGNDMPFKNCWLHSTRLLCIRTQVKIYILTTLEISGTISAENNVKFSLHHSKAEAHSKRNIQCLY